MTTTSKQQYIKLRMEICTATRQQVEEWCKSLSWHNLKERRDMADTLECEYAGKATYSEYYALFKAESLDEMNLNKDFAKKYRKLASTLAGYVILMEEYLAKKGTPRPRNNIEEICGNPVEDPGKGWYRKAWAMQKI